MDFCPIIFVVVAAFLVDLFMKHSTEKLSVMYVFHVNDRRIISKHYKESSKSKESIQSSSVMVKNGT